MANLRPTFHESWYRVAELRARLRPSAQISRQHYRGERWYVVRDPAGNQYHRLSSAAYRFVGLLDGSRTVSEAWDLAGGMLADDAPTQPEVVQILSQLHAANLLEANITPDAGVLLRRHKQLMKRRIQGRLMNILFPRIPLWDLDKFLVRWLPVMRVLLSKFGIVLWLGVIIAACATVAPLWGDLSKAAGDAVSPGNWPFLWATFVIIKLIHELGHAFMCRRFGGEVHELGVMFLVFVPAPYVDASSAWSLPSKWQRILVGAGGMIFELFVAAICAFVWVATKDGSHALVRQLAYNTMLIASVSTIIFNANPLLRYDGYYMLSDWLEIPNLRQKSMEYSFGLIKRHLFRVKSPIPLPPVGQRFWLLLYAITSGVYRVFVGIMIILVVTDQVPVLGVLMAIGGVITWLFVPVGKTLHYLLLDAELHRKRGRAMAWTGAFVAAVVVLIGFIKFPMRFEATGMTQAELQQTLRARSSGFVELIAVKDGQMVKANEPLLICRDKQLETEIARHEAEARSIETSIRLGMVQDPSEKIRQQYALESLNKQLSFLKARQKDLTIRAPFDGLLVAPALHELKGKYLHQGEEVAMVIHADPLIVRAVIDQTEAGLLYMDEPVSMPLGSLPGGWNATPDEVIGYFDKAKAIVTQEPASERRRENEPIRRITASGAKVFDQAADVVVNFENNRIATVSASFAKAAAYDLLLEEHRRQFGSSSATQPVAGGRRSHWMIERDEAALEIDLVAGGGSTQPSTQPSMTTLTYRILGRKVDVRLAGNRSKNLTGRVLTRIPAAVSSVPHPSLTHLGGGDKQNDPKDQTGTRVAVPEFEVRIRVDNPQLANLPGQRAYVRFTMEQDRPLIWQWGRRFWQLIQTQSTQSKWL